MQMVFESSLEFLGLSAIQKSNGFVTNSVYLWIKGPDKSCLLHLQLHEWCMQLKRNKSNKSQVTFTMDIYMIITVSKLFLDSHKQGLGPMSSLATKSFT